MGAIRRHGADLSLDDLAAGAGVSKPVIYDVFGGRGGVATAVALVLADRVEAGAARTLLAGSTIDADAFVDAIVGALIALVDEERELYRFIVRTLGTDGRGILDNALVRVLHERTTPFVSAMVPTLGAERLAVLTDGVHGFVLAALESWQDKKDVIGTEAMVAMLGQVIRAGLRAVGAAPGPGRQGAGPGS